MGSTRFLVLLALSACIAARTPVVPPGPLSRLEAAFAAAREAHDRLEVAASRGMELSDELRRPYDDAREVLLARLGEWPAGSESTLGAADRRALEIMKDVAEHELTAAVVQPAEESAAADCVFDPAVLVARPDGLDTLSARVYACYGRVVQHVRVDGQELDRLTVLGALAHTDDPARRRTLFLALDTIWRTINRDDGATSPYRHLVRATAARWRERGSPIDEGLSALGLDGPTAERWLVSILERWRDANVGPRLEPWDYYYMGGAASRRLGGTIPRDRLRRLNDSVYAALGADPLSLGIRFDLEPRPGKTPVAFTTFGARPHRERGRHLPGEPWVFATYRTGGFDNLNELLHETGHGIHIAAVDTRPAFADWPDSDPFTEAVAELVAQEIYERAWQVRWLGDSVPTADALRSKVAPVMLDLAWALFELRMHRDPSRSPNETWTELTRDYLNIAPHPEWSWWAMRGQLVDSPGYMMNYAIGAIIAADVRARAKAMRGAFTPPDARWYAWLSARLYRFGREKPTREVLRDFLGRDIGPEALLAEVGRR